MASKTRSESQIRAEIAYQKTRKGTPMIPIIYLSAEEAAKVERLKKLYGSKKAGVLQAINGWCELLDANERNGGDGNGERS